MKRKPKEKAEYCGAKGVRLLPFCLSLFTLIISFIKWCKSGYGRQRKLQRDLFDPPLPKNTHSVIQRNILNSLGFVLLMSTSKENFLGKIFGTRKPLDMQCYGAQKSSCVKYRVNTHLLSESSANMFSQMIKFFTDSNYSYL